MSKIVKCEMATTWKRALNAARQTVGKKELDKEPSKKWWASVLLAEHSPIRLVEYDFKWEDIKMWVTTHFVRHHEGCEKFVHTQRDDRRDIGCPRDELPQGELNDMLMPCNAQALINISRKRLCGCASKETREAWQQVKDAIREIDPVIADKMVPECQYRNFCPELTSCGYVNTPKYQMERVSYLRKDYDDCWTPIKDYEGYYEISRFGQIRSVERDVPDGVNRTKHIKQKLLAICPNKKRGNYCYVHLNKNNESKLFQVHRLVAQTFIPNPENRQQVNHKDGNKFNNQVSNLEWVTDLENIAHAWENGLSKANHRKQKIRCIETDTIFNSVVDCSKQMNIDRRGIFRQLKGEIDKIKGYTFERI